MYSCGNVLAELANYLDDEVGAAIRRELEEHLAQCRTCRATYDSARKTVRIVTESRSFELPQSISGQIMKKIASEAQSRPKRRRPRRPRS